MDFDDLYQNDRKRRLSRGKKFRFCCIFLVVAAVTGVILWKIVPRSAANPQGDGAQPASVAPQAVPEKKENAEKDGVQKKSPSAQVQPKKISAVPASDKNTRSKHNVSAADKTGQGGGYRKGVAGPADLSPQADRPVIPPEPQLGGDYFKRIAEVERQFKQKNFAAVTREGEALLSTLTEGSEPYRKVLKYLTEANWQRFLTRDTAEGFAVRYTVVSGDQLGVIARRKQTTVAAIMKANKLKRAGLIRIGQKLTLLPGKWQITVLKSKRLLLLRRDNKIFAGFDIGVGRFGKTPAADFVISERLKHPVYRTGDGRIFKYGDPGNQLGDYFLKLAAVGNPRRPLLGYGIHGTPDETTVSRSLSNGCVRMRNADVEKLYYLVPTGVPVGIRD